MREDEPGRAELLKLQAVRVGICLRLGASVLRVAEDGKAGGHAVQAELVRAARHGVQLQQGGLPGRFQHAVARER